MIGDIAAVDELDQNQVGLSAIKDPVRNSGRHDEDESLPELPDLLVLVSERRSPMRSSQIRLVRLRTAGDRDAVDAGALNDVDEFGRVSVSRQKQTSRPDCMADHANSGALELVVGLVPHLGETGLGLDPVNGLLRAQIVETTRSLGVESVLIRRFASLGFPRNLLDLGEADINEND